MANKRTGRAKPLTSKVSVTRDGKRRYSSGGQLKGHSYKCGGKIKN